MSYAEWLLASRDECEIEALLCDYRGCPPDDEVSIAEMGAANAAIRLVDELICKGEYFSTRDRLRSKIEAHETTKKALEKMISEQKILMADKDLEEDLQNLFNGMKRSPDLEQRARFKEVCDYPGFRGKTPREIAPILAVMERAKGRKGRPKANPPWRYEQDNMSAMRSLIFSGVTISEAARKVASNEGRINTESRADYFERLYRQKLMLRELKSAGF